MYVLASLQANEEIQSRKVVTKYNDCREVTYAHKKRVLATIVHKYDRRNSFFTSYPSIHIKLRNRI